MKPLITCAAIAALFMGAAVPATAHADENAARQSEGKPSAPEETWEVIYIGGQRIGYVHSRSWETTKQGDQRYWTEEVSRMTIKRFGGSLTLITTQLTEEDAQGQLLSFRHEMDNPPASNVQVEGNIIDGELQIIRTVAGQTKKTTDDWDPTVKAPAYVDRQLTEHPLEVGESRTFKAFEPQYLKTAELTLRATSPAHTKLLDGTEVESQRMIMTHSLIPGVEMTIFTDQEGNPVKTESPLMQMVTYTVSETEALKKIAGEELDIAISTLVKVPRIDDPHRADKITYKMTLDRPGLLVEIPDGPTQSVERIDEQTFRITVISLRPDKISESDAARTIDKKYLQCSRELECAHPAVVKLANAAASGHDTPTAIAVAMERYVHEKLTSKNFSTAQATAGEVARTLEGDCTEHAVLLAAMLRVKKIPSRVAVGLVYAPSHSAFGGHMWTEAFLGGRWIPLDATLGIGGIGAGHLKFADSSLDDDGPPTVTTFLPLIGLLEHMSLQVVDPG